MKKILSFILILVTCASALALVSCDKGKESDESPAYVLYNNAYKKTNELNDIHALFDMKMLVSASGQSSSVNYDFEMKATDIQKGAEAKMRIDADITMTGQEMNMDIYLENGWGYYDATVEGTSMKFKTNLNESGDEYAGMFAMGLKEIPAQLFKGVKVVDGEDGAKLLEVEFSGDELLKAYSELATSAGEVKPSDISDAAVFAKINKDGFFTEMTISFSMKVSGVNTSVTLTTEYINPGKAVTVEPMEGYQSFPEQSLS